MRWYLYSFRHIFNYRDRARRAEYGWTFLTNVLLQIAATALFFEVAIRLGLFAPNSTLLDEVGIMLIAVNLIYSLYSIVIGLVGLSLTVRRMHDLGWSGWWLLPIYGFSIMLAIIFIFLAEAVQTDKGNSTIDGIIALFVAMLLYVLFIFIFQLVLLFKDGQPFANKYGESPKHLVQQEA